MARRTTRLHIALTCAVLTSATGAALGATRSPETSMLGFSPAHADEQRALEQRFDAALSAADQREWLKLMTTEPNHVGSPHDKANAEWMLARFKEWGWDARIETFSVLYPTPKTELLELSRRSITRRNCTSRRLPAIPRRRFPARCRRTTSMAAMATSRPRSCTPTRACPTTTRNSRAAASTCAARSSSPATAAAGADSSPNSRRSTARSVA